MNHTLPSYNLLVYVKQTSCSRNYQDLDIIIADNQVFIRQVASILTEDEGPGNCLGDLETG